MKHDPLRALAVGAAVATVALTAAAFWLSYEHLHDIAGANGLDGARAWAWPGTVDLFIIVGELLYLRASLAGRRDRLAVGLTAVGSLGSIALNVAGVGTDADALEYVVAAVPPLAALIAFGALMRQVHERLAVTVTATAVTVEADPPLSAREGDTPGTDCSRSQSDGGAVPAEQESVPAEPRAVPVEPEAVPIGLYDIQTERPGPPNLPVLGPVMPLPVLRLEPAGTEGGTDLDQELSALLGGPAPEGGTASTGPVPEGGTGGTDGGDSGTGDSPQTRFDRHVTTARQWLAEDPSLSGTAIGQRLGTGDSYGRRVRRAALEKATADRA